MRDAGILSWSASAARTVGDPERLPRRAVEKFQPGANRFAWLKTGMTAEFQKDAELKNVYYGTLDQMLERCRRRHALAV